MSEILAGWYPDESASGSQRYWDGTQWTEDTRPQPTPPPQQPLPPQPTAAEPSLPEPDASIDGNSKTGRAAAVAKAIGNKAQKAHENRKHVASVRFGISEEGKNGTVEFEEKGLQRTLKKTLSKDDRQFIPYSSITMVSHDRKRIGRDAVVVQVGTKSYEWRVQIDAEGFVDRLKELMT